MKTKHSEVVNTAQLIRDQRMNVVEGAWRLSILRHEVSQNNFDDDFMLFVAIASETDHLPFSEVRNKYSSDALRKADQEIEEIGKFYREQVEMACEKLIARFTSTNTT